MERGNTHWSNGPGKEELKLRKACAKAHALLGKKDNIVETAESFIDKVNGIITLDDYSINEIENFKKKTNGLILATLKTGKITDIAPLLSILGEKIIDDTTFYTTKESDNPLTIAFNTTSFRLDTFSNDQERKISDIQTIIDIDRIQNTNGYIFINPTGDNTGRNAPFRYITNRMIENANPELPVLINDIDVNGPLNDMSYADIFNILKVDSILKKIRLKTNYFSRENSQIKITSKLLSAGDFKGKNGDESRDIFNYHLGV